MTYPLLKKAVIIWLAVLLVLNIFLRLVELTLAGQSNITYIFTYYASWFGLFFFIGTIGVITALIMNKSWGYLLIPVGFMWSLLSPYEYGGAFWWTQDYSYPTGMLLTLFVALTRGDVSVIISNVIAAMVPIALIGISIIAFMHERKRKPISNTISYVAVAVIMLSISNAIAYLWFIASVGGLFFSKIQFMLDIAGTALFITGLLIWHLAIDRSSS